MGPCIGVGSLTPDRKPSAVPKTTIRSDVHETLHVHGHLGPKGTLHLEGSFDLAPEEVDFLVAKVLSPSVGIDAARLDNLGGPGTPDAEDVRESDFDPLPSGKINACYTCHRYLTLPLLVPRIPLTNDPNHTAATDHLTVLADRFYAGSNLHGTHPVLPETPAPVR